MRAGRLTNNPLHAMMHWTLYREGDMGIFWDLIQQSQIATQQAKTGTLEERVAILETEVRTTRQILGRALAILEQQTNTDLDGDGRVG
jgi:hypothetical protein